MGDCEWLTSLIGLLGVALGFGGSHVLELKRESRTESRERIRQREMLLLETLPELQDVLHQWRNHIIAVYFQKFADWQRSKQWRIGIKTDESGHQVLSLQSRIEALMSRLSDGDVNRYIEDAIRAEGRARNSKSAAETETHLKEVYAACRQATNRCGELIREIHNL